MRFRNNSIFETLRNVSKKVRFRNSSDEIRMELSRGAKVSELVDILYIFQSFVFALRAKTCRLSNGSASSPATFASFVFRLSSLV